MTKVRLGLVEFPAVSRAHVIDGELAVAGALVAGIRGAAIVDGTKPVAEEEECEEHDDDEGDDNF